MWPASRIVSIVSLIEIIKLYIPSVNRPVNQCNITQMYAGVGGHRGTPGPRGHLGMLI